MKEQRAILAVSFGTTHLDALKRDIEPVEARLREEFPDHAFYRAFTSAMVIRALSRKGVEVDTVEIALESMLLGGVREVLVQPTHILRGAEVEKLERACEKHVSRFSSLKIAAPLLNTESDLLALAGILKEEYKALKKGAALVLVGHGSHRDANSVYAQLEGLLKENGLPHAYVGTVEASPDLEEVLNEVARAKYRAAHLTPLMLVAGDHAQNDIAGDEEDSWKSTFTRAGLEVSFTLQGLGSLRGVQELYAAHARTALLAPSL